MARCPHCNYKLQMIDVKAECPVCGVNIPNYNWEERLDEDAVNAEKAFAKFRISTGAFKSALFGSKFRIARFVLTFAPLLFLLFPMASVNANLPFSDGFQGVSLLNVILAVVNGTVDIGSMISFTSLSLSGTAFTVLYAALALVLLSVVAGVLNFFVILLSGTGFHAKGNVICCWASVIFVVGAIICVLVSSSMFASAVPDVVTVKLSYGLFIALALFAVNLVMNSVARKQFDSEKAEMALKREAAEKGSAQ